MHGERHGEEGCTGANQEPAAVRHSITSFARAKRDWDIVKPIALAVLRLTTRSN